MIRSWHETPGAIWRARLGTPHEERTTESMEAVSRQVELASLEHERDYGRPFTEAERKVAAQGLELRGRAAAGFASPTLDRADLDRLGIGYVIEPEKPERGIAVYDDVNGVWQGDPDVVKRLTETPAGMEDVPPETWQEAVRRAEARVQAAKGVPNAS